MEQSFLKHGEHLIHTFGSAQKLLHIDPDYIVLV